MNNNFNEKFEDDNVPINDGFDMIEDQDSCPMMDVLISMLMMDRPFGIVWNNGIMENFLINRGYKIITRYSNITESDYKVAFKSSDSCIPETDVDNIRSVFNNEVQEILSNWLLKIGK